MRPRRRQPTRLPHPWESPARTLEWGAISFSNAWKWKVKVKALSHVWLCATPQTAAYQAPLSLGFSRQEHWSGLPFPSPMHESEKWKWSRSVMSNSVRPHRRQPTRLSHPWDFAGKSTGVGCHCLLQCAMKKGWKSLWELSYCSQPTVKSSWLASPTCNGAGKWRNTGYSVKNNCLCDDKKLEKLKLRQ